MDIQSWSCNQLFALTMIAGALISFVPIAYASDEEVISLVESVNLQTFSVGNQTQLVEEAGLDTRLNQLKQQKPFVLPSTKAKSREQIIAEHKNGKTSPKYSLQKSGLKTANDDAQSAVPKAFSNPIYHEFSIYEASSRLFVDDDANGFYQTFSVTFDADVFGPDAVEIADVYAELYLSRDGGPWVHYYTTDIFTILGDTSDDDFEVMTTLHNGYYTDHYDVLVDLYEVGFDDIVATISSDDTDNLYALPLESSDRDAVYTGGDASSEGQGGGAFSFISILALGLFACLRRRKLSP
ncbi:choice-of-anchor H family protein [Shewanella psychrophila]|nr:choice-of-anchor H family protein [Shewanella psychrophila]